MLPSNAFGSIQLKRRSLGIAGEVFLRRALVTDRAGFRALSTPRCPNALQARRQDARLRR